MLFYLHVRSRGHGTRLIGEEKMMGDRMICEQWEWMSISDKAQRVRIYEKMAAVEEEQNRWMEE
jgi:hypothetical protein